jgi:hypothetical protein
VNILRMIFGGLLLCWASAALAQGNDALEAGIRNIERQPGFGSRMEVARRSGKALEMADTISEPELFVAAMLLSANPEVWLNAMEGAGKAGTLRNFAQLAGPGSLADRFYDAVDPRFQRAILSRALDKSKAQRWMDSMSDRRFFMPAIAVLSPSNPVQWVKVSATGRTIEPGRQMLDDGPSSAWARLETSQDGVAIQRY